MADDPFGLKGALLYPWNDGDSGTTLFGGGVLTLLSPLVIPALLVLGYTLRVVESVMDGDEEPPALGDWLDLLVDGVKAAIVLLVYVALPLVVGLGVLAVLVGLAGFRFQGGVPTLSGTASVGGLAFVVALLLAGLALLVWYLAPAALVHLARTRRLRAAFAFDEVRALAEESAYGSMWLLAVGVFAANAVVLLVLNAAGVGVILSGFVSFYAFVAMASLYAEAADAAGYEVEGPRFEPGEGEAEAEAGADGQEAETEAGADEAEAADDESEE